MTDTTIHTSVMLCLLIPIIAYQMLLRGKSFTALLNLTIEWLLIPMSDFVPYHLLLCSEYFTALPNTATEWLLT